MKNFLRSAFRALLYAFGKKPEPTPISSRVQITSIRIECEDCGHRTLMTVNGTCAVCGGTSFENSAKLLRGKLEQLQALKARKFPTKTEV